MPKIIFTESAFAEYMEWQNIDKKMLKRINLLLKEICRTPFSGTGKPEPLKGSLSGFWSRRIDEKHRLVYRAGPQSIEITQCMGHYDK